MPWTLAGNIQGPAGADSTVPGPQGEIGETGPAGADSTVPGPAGADSTVPGPQGEPGVTDANALTGTILAPNVVTSSLTTVGTLSGLTVTAPIAGSVTGNAATATALATPRAINGVSFDGSAPITVPAAAGTLTGTILAAGVVTSSLTTVGTLSGLTVTAPIVGSVTGAAGSVDAADLTGTILDPGVVTSSLTSVGTLGGLTVTAAIAGSVTGAAGSVPAANLTGTILAAGVVTSSLTTVGTLSGLTVTAPIAGSVTGSAASATGNAATATALATPRAINGVNFDGSAAITVTAAAGTLSGATLAAGVTASSLTSVGTLASLTLGGALSGVTDLTTTGNTILGNASTDTLNVGNGGLVKDANGVVGIGETPPAWGGTASVISVGSQGGYLKAENDSLVIGVNSYYNGTSWIRRSGAGPSRYYQTSGAHYWAGNTSGAAGSTYTPTTRMTLDSNGNLILTAALSGVTNLTTTGNTILGDASTDTLNVGNGGLIKDASGNVGIGPSTVTANLHIERAVGATLLLKSTGTASSEAADFTIVGNDISGRFTVYGSNHGSRGSQVWVNANTAATVLILSTGNTERVRIDASGQLLIKTVGTGLSIAEGSNAKMGVSTLVAGTVTVSTTAVTSTSRIFITYQSLGTISLPAAIGVTARTAGTSFTITSATITDTSVIAWHLIEPSA